METGLETPKERLWREWGIDGMPLDKRRLAEAVWEAAIASSNTTMLVKDIHKTEKSFDSHAR